MNKDNATNVPKKIKGGFSSYLSDMSELSAENILARFESSSTAGLKEDDIEEKRKEFGSNVLAKGHRDSGIKRFILAFANPFSIVLLILGVVSFVTDVILSPDKDPSTPIVILSLVILSSIFRFITEDRSSKAIAKLSEMVETTVAVTREGKNEEIPIREIVVGDIVHLANGDIIPADIRLLETKDFFVSQSSLTGESEPIEKVSFPVATGSRLSITDCQNLAFMGSTVVSGSASAIVIKVGNGTYFGQIASKLGVKKGKSAFNQGIDKVSWLFIRFIIVLVPAVFLINGFTKGDWLSSFLFALSVTVGLTPEMLPMIVTSCLAKGAIMMSKHKVIVKSIDSIQNFGAIDILCTDKTGTLTQDKVALEDHFNVMGKRDPKVLRHAFLNSYFQTGLKNLMDKSVIVKTHELEAEYPMLLGLETSFVKIDEIPFDFQRKRMSVVVKDKNGKTQLITKGAVEEVISICSFAQVDGQAVPLDDKIKKRILARVSNCSKKGYRVIAVAQKTNPAAVGAFSVKDEADMVFIGYLTFYDPPKESASATIASLKKYGVTTKILTGDNVEVSVAIANKVGIASDRVMTGFDVEALNEEGLAKAVEEVSIFAKLSPEDKAIVVDALKKNGHVVGYMGDGINDAPALKSADIGISVDSAADIAKESAHVILLEKDLLVLEDGIIEGRRTYGNMIKYIKMTASSNFGNIFSELIAAIFLPFLPMLPIHLLILNLMNDLACTAIPWDRVDEEMLLKPKKWDASGIGKFMLVFGPISSVFDWVTYATLFFLLCPRFAGGSYNDPGVDQSLFTSLFQTGWFVESMWTQILIILLLRSRRLPFGKNKPSKFLIFSACVSLAIVTALPYTPLGNYLSLTPLGWEFYVFLSLVIVSYMALTSLVKHFYMRREDRVLIPSR